MSRFLHLYKIDSLINKPTILSVDISKFENNYPSIYDGLKSQVDESDAIIIEENCFEIKSQLFEFITYFRINKCKNWDIPIFIFKDKLSNKDAFDLLKNDFNNIIKTKRFDIISSKDLEKDVLTDKISLFRNLDIKLKESLIFEEFIKTINVEGSNLNNHSIANEWAIYRWAKTLNISDSEIEKITERVQNDLYFKYLQALNPISPSSIISDEELKIPFSGNVPKILYVDDEADKGWYEIFCNILYDNNEFDFSYLGDELKGISQDKIIELVFDKVVGKQTDLNTKNAITDIVLLDFRLHQSDFTEANIKEVTGYKILKKIKDYNPGIQVIVISATNKIWNLQALQEAGVDGFILKENVENSQDLNFTNSSIKSFVKNINRATSLVFLKEIFTNIFLIKNKLLNISNESNLKGLDKLEKIKLKNEISIQLDIAYDCLKKSYLSVSHDIEEDYSYFNLSYISLFKIIELINDYYISERDNKLKFSDYKIKSFNQNTGVFTEYPKDKYPTTKDKLLNIFEFELNSKANIISAKLGEIINKRNNIVHPKSLKDFKKTDKIDNLNFLDLINQIISKIN